MSAPFVPEPIAAGLRLAVGTLSIWPAGLPRADRETAGWAMTLAPLVGLLLGLAAGAVMTLAGLLVSPLLAAVAGVAALAALTRGLHLDGLADLADGLGSGRPAAQALEIMKRSDIGPFGVVTLVLTALAQVAAAAEAGPAALVLAGTAGRLAVTWACVAGVPAARPGGLGAMVAGTVRRTSAIYASAAVAAAALAIGLVAEHPVIYLVAAAAGLGAAWAVLAHAIRRLGGITGDVLGALVEVSATIALVVCAAAP
ncbi:adenosylcobinamide-GDP ribazoletransferase [Sphaerisporangium krabiense]|uniref:Adenosylcobinamide-GDP ribazoletransferase n=1 Tax=Sphaerisporangium krabiense TaxID=763782 RepID=A0A7W8Z850_9ACTN|nr:adenosylcobinamide-GDP ribazoletransferase [Sphaerisporangium krabiense]MBB5629126.1 adenosylcobinamide-GDP ribazoletransferase [Sphaerisporangium krabiense]GII60034.1 adenosylcobinamide-GDP ribazoletransferase [Sphaerisporangium krabiense]